MITTLKTCFKCKTEKPIEDFYRHSAMTDGHLGKCKECAKTDVTKNRIVNLDRIRAYDLERAKLPHRRAQAARIVREYGKKYPGRRKANSSVTNAVRDGRLIKPEHCEDCGESHNRIHGHHEDYSKPLDVDWLCPPCHKQRHLQ